MSFCINPKCSQPENPDNQLFCHSCGSELLLAGEYRVLRLLSSKGGFSQTYEVLDDECIVRVLKALTNDNPQVVELFKRESEILCDLEHPGIPKGEGYFTYFPQDSDAPIHCLVMEKIEGMDLEAYQKQRSHRPIDQKSAIKWLKQLTEILHEVHSQNFFHRDIKPSNIILQPNGHLALIDFGAVRQVTATIIAGERSTGVYTPGYAPPEQEKGYALPQSDFYALGRTFVYLLTGKSPTDITIYDQYNNELKWEKYAPRVNPELVDLITELMAEKANQRPASTAVILEKIKEIEAILAQRKSSITANSTDKNTASKRLATQSKNSSVERVSAASLDLRGSQEKFESLQSQPTEKCNFSGEAITQREVGSAQLTSTATQNSIGSDNQVRFETEPHSSQGRANNNKFILAAAIVALAVPALGIGSYSLMKPFLSSSLAPEIESERKTTHSELPDIPFSEDWVSRGERVLFVGKSNFFRDLGVEAFNQGKYAEAVTLFEKAVNSDRNDPEVQIYLNNSKARLAGSPLLIATVVPVDNRQDSAAEMLRGVADAQTRFNQEGGVGGRLVEVLIANDGNRPKISASIANKLGSNSQILGVIGHNSSSATGAGLKEYEKAGLPIVSPTSSSTSLEAEVFFRTTHSDATSAEKLAEFTKNNLGIDQVAVFYNPNSSYSNSLFKAFESIFRDLGGEVIGAIDLSDQNLDPNTEIKGLRGKVKAIALFPNTSTTSVAIAIARANNELPGKKFQLLGGDALYSSSTITSGGRAVEGLIMPIPWFSGTQAYAVEAAQRWLGTVNWRTATSFDGTVALLEALSANSNRATVSKQLKDSYLQATKTSGKPLQFTPEGERDGEPVIVQISRDAPNRIRGVELGFKLIEP